MNYTKKDIIIGFVIIAIIVFGAFMLKKSKTPKPIASSSPVSINYKKELENNFKYTIPEDANSVELKDISNGNGRGIATEKEILADIDDPAQGYYYEGWIEDTSNGNKTSIGKLQLVKGGWFLEYNGSLYQKPYKVVVSLEKVLDSKSENKILEGVIN